MGSSGPITIPILIRLYGGSQERRSSRSRAGRAPRGARDNLETESREASSESSRPQRVWSSLSSSLRRESRGGRSMREETRDQRSSSRSSSERARSSGPAPIGLGGFRALLADPASRRDSRLSRSSSSPPREPRILEESSEILRALSMLLELLRSLSRILRALSRSSELLRSLSSRPRSSRSRISSRPRRREAGLELEELLEDPPSSLRSSRLRARGGARPRGARSRSAGRGARAGLGGARRGGARYRRSTIYDGSPTSRIFQVDFGLKFRDPLY